MRVAFVNSGLGLLTAAASLRRRCPDADLVLSMDPEAMPWGPRSPQEITERTLLCARAAREYQPDAVVLACNTATVHAIEALRAEFEPEIPVLGTVPAIKPAAAVGGPVAVWATVATTGSAYQRQLISQFAHGRPMTLVACPGLADAVDAADNARIQHAVTAACAQTPAGIAHLVLGCTEYELITDMIHHVLPGVVLHGSAPAVITHALHRIGSTLASKSGSGRLDVLLSGRPGRLPDAAASYSPGRELTPVYAYAAQRPLRDPSPHTT